MVDRFAAEMREAGRTDFGGWPRSAADAGDTVRMVLGGVLGLDAAAVPDRLVLAPVLPEHWDRMEVRYLRVGRTVLDIGLSRRWGRVALRVAVRFGPALAMTVRPGKTPPMWILLDDHEVTGMQVGFRAAGEHHLVWGEIPARPAVG